MDHGSRPFYAVDILGGGGLTGTTGARRCILYGVLKQNAEDSPFLVANEFIAGRLAMSLGLPVPPGVIVRLDDDAIAYVGLQFGPKGESPPPIIPSDLVRDTPDLVAKIVAFDCWIANSDRHESNLAYVKGVVAPIIFDHDQALFGAGGWRRLDRLEHVRDQGILNGCLGKLVINFAPLSSFADRIKDICRGPDSLMSSVCKEARVSGAMLEKEEDALVEFLEHRSNTLLEMLKKLPSLKGQMEMI